jgi:hypothetical protein
MQGMQSMQNWKAFAVITVVIMAGSGVIGMLFGGPPGAAGAGETVLKCNTVFVVSGTGGSPQTMQYEIQVSFSPNAGTAGMSAISQWGLLGGSHPASITNAQISWSEPVANGGHADISIDRNTSRFSGFVSPPLPFRINGTCSAGPAF